MEDDYERVLLVKPECLVYRLPPRSSTNRGYRAADWGLDKPSWTGRLRITVKANKLEIKLEDKISGELFAKAPVDEYPGIAVESVSDSSRYFVIRISDESKRTAFIGVGFADRGDAFDFNVTLQDHFKRVKTEEVIEKTPDIQPNLNLGLKEGQTFTIKLGNTSKSKTQTKPKTNLGGGLLPPPPGDVKAHPKQDTSTEWGEFASASSSNSSSSSNWVQF
ncbi:adaptin ear-binding coat-associated protein 1-like [Clavelina lepadiformis]|uniref:NECAP PHear domain-containing protein n=1 Tax=Clavelina lepadiformis TaxID=159417 RepID=A0ABP0GX53_CLALP